MSLLLSPFLPPALPVFLPRPPRLPVLRQVGNEQGGLAALSEQHGEDLDLLPAREEEGHGHARDTSHLHVIDEDGELEAGRRGRKVKRGRKGRGKGGTERGREGGIGSIRKWAPEGQREGNPPEPSPRRKTSKALIVPPLCPSSLPHPFPPVQGTFSINFQGKSASLIQYTAKRRRSSSVPFCKSEMIEWCTSSFCWPKNSAETLFRE